MPEKELLLKIEDLEIDFISNDALFHAVKKINISLYRGETLGIVGESGSGKTVTSLSILQLIQTPPGKIKSGHIWFYENGNAVDLLTLGEKELNKIRGKQISMIFQEPMTSLNPVMRCGEQVAESIRLHLGKNNEEAKAMVLELFDKVQLTNIERIYNSYPHQLSGGQKQRIVIAIAMSCNPSIIIADEPTTALDVTVQKSILQLLQSLKETLNVSIIFITHDLAIIQEIADNVIVMYKGEIVEHGNVKDIFSNPKNNYTKSLLACRPSFDKIVKELPTIADFQSAANYEWQYLSKEEKSAHSKSLITEIPFLKIENLSVSFPTSFSFWGKPTAYFEAVKNISFNIYKGETLGLVGESGCGKTSLSRALLNLIVPSSGSIFYNNRDLTTLNAVEWKLMRKEFQIIFQDPYASLNPAMTIGAAILEPMQVHHLHQNDNQRKEKVIELLESVGLEASHYDRYPHEFSGGQRQRICIARALSIEPSFLICDESVSALDVSVQAQVLNLLNNLKTKYNLTMLFISHDLSVIKHISDRIIVMQNGIIVEQEIAEELYQNPKSEYTKTLIQAVPKLQVSI
jgi:peptide/nickel transport system ATP-binding protein